MKNLETLGAVKDGQLFLFGGVVFTKDCNTKDEMVMCRVGTTKATVYITKDAVVSFTPEADVNLRRRIETLDPF